jgi:hypothetical protein
MGNVVRIEHHKMDAALCRGAATPLDASVSWLVRYLDAWWVVYPGGWLKITDDLKVGDVGSELPI